MVSIVSRGGIQGIMRPGIPYEVNRTEGDYYVLNWPKDARVPCGEVEICRPKNWKPEKPAMFRAVCIDKAGCRLAAHGGVLIKGRVYDVIGVMAGGMWIIRTAKGNRKVKSTRFKRLDS